MRRKTYLSGMNEQPGTPESGKSPKKRGKQAVDYTASTKIFRSCTGKAEYLKRTNKRVLYEFGVIIRAELYRRGLNIRGLVLLCRADNWLIKEGTIQASLSGSGYDYTIRILYRLAYLLNIDLSAGDVQEAREYLRANGRSVKDF